MVIKRVLLPGAAAVMLAVACRVADAQSEIGRWLDSRLGTMPAGADYRSTLFFEEDLDQPGRDLQIEQHDLNILAPLLQDEAREWSLQAGFRALDLHTTARLPDTDEAMPDSLWDVWLGTAYRFDAGGGRTAGARLTVGSPSDRPFDSAEDLAVRATAFLRQPHGETDAWIFLLDYASDREFLPHVPLPGIAYSWRPNERFSALLGVPFVSARWRPTDEVTLSATYRLPRTLGAKAAWTVTPGTDLYLGFDWANQRYFRADRRDKDDRLFYYEKQAMLGVRRTIGEHAWLDVAGGYAFDRFWFEGKDYGERSRNRLNLDDGPLFLVQLGVRF